MGPNAANGNDTPPVKPTSTTPPPNVPPPNKAARAIPQKETPLEQAASLIGFFVWLLVFKSFFLQLFIIPTGSMAETLCGAQSTHTCPNCGTEYQIGFDRVPDRLAVDPERLVCPNCRWEDPFANTPLQKQGQPTSGDRIVVHGWPYVLGDWLPASLKLGPQAWDVVVFKNPNDPDMNYIKRLIGLPGQKIEIIDGDVFVNDKIAQKTRAAQHSLWFRYYDHDHRPKQPSQKNYLPHWAALTKDNGWAALETRAPRFDALKGQRGEIRFVTQAGDGLTPGEVTDLYGYDAPTPRQDAAGKWYIHVPSGHNMVQDVRLSCEVTLEEGDGYVELSTTKYFDAFSVRLYADGRATLEQEELGTRERRSLGEIKLPAPPRGRPVHFALSNADYVVRVEIDGRPIVRNPQAAEEDDRFLAKKYAPSVGEARRRATGKATPPILQIAAEGVRARLARLLIERDVYYTDVLNKSLDPGSPPISGNGSINHPITLGPDEYFVMGDNSPCSFDARYWDRGVDRDGIQSPGPHLRGRPNYQVGTVPADQLIGPAFLVYWPGFLPLFSGGPHLLPDLGRVRWIY